MNKFVIAAVLSLTAGLGVASAQGPERGDPRPAFTELDSDGDGRVTQSEFDAFRESRYAALDADGNGTISRDEFVAASVARAEARADRMFDRLDSDGDGALSQDVIALRAPGERMIARLDTDGDGAVSETEFEAAEARRAEMRGDRHGMFGRGGGRWSN